jgi:hypothetical protein
VRATCSNRDDAVTSGIGHEGCCARVSRTRDCQLLKKPDPSCVTGDVLTATVFEVLGSEPATGRERARPAGRNSIRPLQGLQEQCEAPIAVSYNLLGTNVLYSHVSCKGVETLLLAERIRAKLLLRGQRMLWDGPMRKRCTMTFASRPCLAVLRQLVRFAAGHTFTFAYDHGLTRVDVPELIHLPTRPLDFIESAFVFSPRRAQNVCLRQR